MEAEFVMNDVSEQIGEGPLSAGTITNKRFAVLIDADNVPKSAIRGIMEEIAIHGTPTIKRIYGDWTSPNIGGWKQSLLENAITPIQQYSYTTGKNSTDSAMIIDAMDILYSNNVDGFVIVSSDSDFTRLAVRLREAGKEVIGIGERKTPQPFIVSCDKFIYIEVIKPPVEAMPESRSIVSYMKAMKASKSKHAGVPDHIERMIADTVAALAEHADTDGFVYMGELGNLISKKMPDFDCRSYGFKSLSALIKSLDRFEIDFRRTADPNVKHPYVKDKKAAE